MNSIKSIVLEKLVLQEIEGYGNAFIKPYEMHVDGTAINRVAATLNSLNQGGTNNVDAGHLASASHGIITPGLATDIAPIPYGWATKRLRFGLDVTVEYLIGTIVVYRFQGFTDYHDPGFNHKLDPNMTFVINSCTETVRMINHGNISERAKAANQYLQRAGADDIPGDIYSMRPNDIFTTVQVRDMMDVTGELAAYGLPGSDNVVDKSTALDSSPKLSTRANQSPGSYLAHILNAYQQGMHSMELGLDKGNLISSAATMAREDHSYDNPFIAELHGTMNNYVSSGTFTYGNILNLDPTIDDRVNLVLASPNLPSEYLDMADMTTNMAYSIANSVSSMLSRSLLSSVSFTATNITLDGQTACLITNVGSGNPTPLDLATNQATFQNMVMNELMPYITQENLITLKIEVIASLNADANIKIWIGGTHAEPVPYIIPIFADSLFSFNVTTNKDDVQNMAMSTDNFINSVSDLGLTLGQDIEI